MKGALMCGSCTPWSRLGRAVLGALVGMWLVGCSTTFDNLPLNRPVTAQFVEQNLRARDVVDSDVVALSFSGGGMRAAAFSFGVLQALASADEAGTDLFDDISFISSVSGGSLTAAYTALHGRQTLAHFRQQVLDRDLERDLRLSWFSPANLNRLVAGGVNDRSNLATALDKEVFKGATFADLYRLKKPDVWINATDLYNRTPFPFIPSVFLGLCSDLSQLRISEAVAASMAVPLAFAPVVLKTFPDQCLTPLPAQIDDQGDDPGVVAAGIVAASARAAQNYRDPTRMQYVKLSDGGLTDNQGLASILVARAMSGTPYGPFSEADAIRLKRMLFLIVDAGRPPSGNWALERDGPSGLDVGIAAADAAIDSATRLSVSAFRNMTTEWRDSIVLYRCGLSAEYVKQFLKPGQYWRCDDVRFFVGTVSAASLEPQRAARLRDTPTRLTLPRQDIDAVIDAGRDAARRNSALHDYLADRAALP
jgi:NTE family protein